MTKFIAFKQKHPDLKAYVTDGDFHHYVLDTMRDGAASNGFYGLILALELCDKVSLFGYAKDVSTVFLDHVSPALQLTC